MWSTSSPPIRACRTGSRVYGDLNGQINALDLGIRRLTALLDEFGDVTVAAAMSELRARAAQLMRMNIAELKDGTYSARVLSTMTASGMSR